MPQIYFEYSANIVEKNINEIASHIHKILVKELPTKIENCKTRILKYQEFFIGNGEANNAFIYLKIDVMPGRSKNLIDTIAAQILNYLKESFTESLDKLNLQIAVAIDNIAETYSKL